MDSQRLSVSVSASFAVSGAFCAALMLLGYIKGTQLLDVRCEEAWKLLFLTGSRALFDASVGCRCCGLHLAVAFLQPSLPRELGELYGKH